MSSRVALVTGSARGLGLAVARALAARGDLVHVVHRTPTPAVAELEREFEGRAHAADVTDPAGVRALVEGVVERDGRLDVLVHAVGEYAPGPLEGYEHADLQRMFRSNVESAALLVDAARTHLRAARGNALLFGCSGNDQPRAWRETAVYAAAKTALLVLVRSWAVEEAPHGVRFNMVSPGHVPHEHAASDTTDPALWGRIPMGVPGAPSDVAEAALYLTGQGAGYVTGVNLAIAGGWML